MNRNIILLVLITALISGCTNDDIFRNVFISREHLNYQSYIFNHNGETIEIYSNIAPTLLTVSVPDFMEERTEVTQWYDTIPARNPPFIWEVIYYEKYKTDIYEAVVGDGKISLTVYDNDGNFSRVIPIYFCDQRATSAYIIPSFYQE